MELLAFLCFAALLVGWFTAPKEYPQATTIELTTPEAISAAT